MFTGTMHFWNFSTITEWFRLLMQCATLGLETYGGDKEALWKLIGLMRKLPQGMHSFFCISVFPLSS